MAKWIKSELVEYARKADLYGFLLRHHANDIEIEGNGLRLRENHSLTLKKGYSGWRDWSKGEDEKDKSGNAIDLLVNYLGYDFQGAVVALCADMGITGIDAPQQPKPKPQTPPAHPTAPLTPPTPLQGQYKQLYAYLTQTRKIPPDIVHRLVHDNLLYQEADHANIVFINLDRTFAELRGTNTYKPFHQVMFSDSAAFWWFKGDRVISNDTVAYICESAIDAISLYLLHMSSSSAKDGLYCSIAGVANQQRIDHIKHGMADAGLQAVIAVDNDDAGQKCRERNADCPCLIPTGKDWNEDWQNRKGDDLSNNSP